MLQFRVFHCWYILLILQGSLAVTAIDNKFFIESDAPNIIRFRDLCNCHTDAQCVSKIGGCMPDNCVQKIGGSKCQEFLITDIVQKHTHSIPPTLLDGNKLRCRPPEWKDSNDTFVVTGDFKPHKFHFIGIHFTRDEPKGLDVTVVLLAPGGDLRHEYPGADELELHSVTRWSWELRINRHALGTFIFSRFHISNLPHDMCTLEFLLGRNVALTRAGTWHNSVFHNFIASNAVDGDVSSCAHGIPKMSNPYLRVVLYEPAIINYIVIIFGRVHRDATRYFHLTYYDANDTESDHYKSDAYSLPWEYHVAMPSEREVGSIKIDIKEKKAPQHVLQVCEVMIIGAFKCPANTAEPFCQPCPKHTAYGQDCKPCPSNCFTKRCDPRTGQCMDGCKDGRYSKLCDKECAHCPALACYQMTGECVVVGSQFSSTMTACLVALLVILVSLGLGRFVQTIHRPEGRESVCKVSMQKSEAWEISDAKSYVEHLNENDTENVENEIEKVENVEDQAVEETSDVV